jgi:hypothetical protein
MIMAFRSILDEQKPSVTTVLNCMLPHDEIYSSPANAAVGSLIHYRILSRLAIAGIPVPDIDITALPENATDLAAIAVTRWNDLGLVIGHPRTIEVTRFNQEHRFCGTPDMTAPVNGSDTIVEIKTSATITHQHRLQVGAYHALTGQHADTGLICAIHPYIPGPAMVEWLDERDLNVLMREFLAILKCYHNEYLPDGTPTWR